MAKGKSTMGRQKIEIKPIESKEARQVCFSKRRPSVFKKASELSILCGAQVAAVVFSPGGNCFSFGHPSVSSVTDRFLAMGDHAMGGGSHGGDGVVDTAHEMNHQLAELQQLMGAEKQRKERVQEALKRESEGRVMRWVNTDVRALGLDELEEFHRELAALQGMVHGKVYQVLQEAKHTKKPLPQSHMYTASASPFLLGGRSVTPMSTTTTLHSSSYGLHEWPDVNSMFSGSQRVGGADIFFDGQFGG